jgi:predicted phosphodiesterase
MRLAVIADIHANAPALEAVLADADRVQPDLVVQLGDACNGPVDPVGTLARLRELPRVRHVRGNGDREIGQLGAVPQLKSARFARERLTAADCAWLGEWPQVVISEGWLACHGSPWDDTEYLLEHVTEHGVFPRAPADIANRVGPTPASLVLCGHTHVPRVVQLPGRALIVNPGSVGLPAYSDKEPFPHRMEAGSPHARYAIVERRSAGWHVELRAVPYDHERAAVLAEANGAPDWARALRTGFA